MLLIDNLVLEGGQTYPRVYFNGSKNELLDAIKCCGMVTFTRVLEGHSKELNAQANFIVSYETEIEKEDLGLEGVQVFLFPTAGFGSNGAFKPQDKSSLNELFQIPDWFFKKPLLGK